MTPTDEAAVEQCDRDAAAYFNGFQSWDESQKMYNRAARDTLELSRAFAAHVHTERQRAERAEKLLEEAVKGLEAITRVPVPTRMRAVARNTLATIRSADNG